MPRPTGTPTWLDYGAPQLSESLDFYGALFGWDFEDSGPQLNHYTMAHKDGAPVCGLMDTTGVTGPDGAPLPAAWNVFLAVDDIGARLAKAQEAGARVLMEPGHMAGTGTFALLADPTGARIGLWEADGFDGYAFSGAPGTPVWFELMSMDFDASARFYADVFDFEVTPEGAQPGTQDDSARQQCAAPAYATNARAERASAGICAASAWFPAGTVSFWRLYFGVADADAAIERIRTLGGSLLDGPMDSPFGRIATVADPKGAGFQINQPLPDQGA